MPFPASTNPPPYELSIGPRGEHFITFQDYDPKLLGRVTLEADMLLCVAFEMCTDDAHVDTQWALRHLRAKGYRIKDPKRGWFQR